MITIDKFIDNSLKLFDTELRTLYKEDNKLFESINYSLLAGGKRLRPLIIMSILKDLHLNITLGLPCAISIEMIHTYSLIHDDLPCMDDDNYRRGNLTNHKKYDEATALLAGDSLLTDAFNILSNCKYEDDIKLKLISKLSECAGSSGMIMGQMLDLQSENKEINVDQIKEIHILKTAKLFEFCFYAAGLISNKVKITRNSKKLATSLGILFQAQDDLLEITSSTEELGKDSNSDTSNNKNTYITLKGIDYTKSIVDEHYTLLINLLDDYPLTKELLNMIYNRKK